MAGSDDWQKKYKILSKELEQAEEYTSRLLEQLKIILTQLSLALKGQDKELDDAMQSLVSSMDAIEVRKLRSYAKDIETRVTALSIEPITSASTLSHSIDSLENELSEDLADNRDMEIVAITVRLLEVLQLLRIPNEHSHHVHSLIAELESNPDLERLPAILDDLIKLMRLAGMNLGEDFEDYLLSLNQQLSYVQNFLTENQKEELKASQRHSELDKAVRQDVSQINHTVKQSNDLVELKQAVSRQLASIIKSMDEHKKTEESREQCLKERYEELLGKVAQMEKEAEQVKHRIEEEQLKARTDPLTGLPNRYAYDRHIITELERWERYNVMFSLCVADLDFFKQVNDDYGHLAGDKVLRLMARILQKNLRKIDIVTRFGGEEFVIIMPSTDGTAATQAVEKVRKVIEESPFNFQGKPVRITMSFGVTEVQSGDTPDEIFSRADRMLYHAKETGRNKALLG
jgi:diguanylate cyclase